MSVPLPVLSNPCIAAASSTSVYLIGIPNAMGGHLQMYSVALGATFDSPVAVPVGKEQVTNTWEVQAKMACFSYGAITSPHDTVLLVQVSRMRTDVANLRSSGAFDYPLQIPGSTLKSTKLLTQVGAYSTFAWFTGFTTTNAESPWKGMRFLSTNVSAYISDEQITQAPTKTPFMAVGTYDISAKSSTQGHSIIFDSATSGAAYPATGSAETLTGAVSLSAPIALDMHGITLTNKSIPVTMGNVAYILDEAADSSIVAYTITPSITNKLSTISITGKAPSFLSVQSATSLDNKIVVYSVNNSSVPTLNVFDALSRTWSGPGLIGSGTSKPISSITGATSVPNANDNDSGFPVAPVVGGIFALAIVVWTVFWTARNRRRRRKEQESNDNNNADGDQFSTQKLEMDPRQQKHSTLTIQEEAGTASSQQQQQHAAYPTHYPSTHLTPLNVHPHSAPRVPNPAPSPRKDYTSPPQPPYNPQYISSVSSNLQCREEEEPLGWK